MIDITQMGTVLAIVVIAYLIGLTCKAINKLDNKFIPVIVGASGGILGAICLYIMPDFPANDIVNAIAIGIVSGLASTGVNQVYQQIKNN